MLRLLTLIFIAYPCLLFSQDVGQLIKEAEVQEQAFHENEAFLKYAEVVKKDPNNLVALWKCSELSSRLGARQTDKEKMRPYFMAARNYAAAALRVNPNSSEANCAMAFALGRVSGVSSTRERVELAKDVKWYVDKAIQLDPNNFRAWHILGRWNFEVSNLNLAEKSFARLFYGKIPSATLDDAVLDFEKSRSLNPAFLLNYLELAKCYHRKDDDKKAMYNLRLLISMPNSMYDDARAKTVARKLMDEWQ